MVETDVRRDLAGTLVLSHDPLVEGPLVEGPLVEGPLVEGPLVEGPLVEGPLAEGEEPLQLAVLLATLPTFPLNLEIKNFPGEPDFDPDHATALRTAELARPFDLLTCFFWPTVDEVHRRFPDVATGLLVDVGWDLARSARHALALGHRTLAVHWSLVLATPDVARASAEEGLALVVWTLNDPEYVPKLAELGVTGIITDDPGAMAAAIQT